MCFEAMRHWGLGDTRETPINSKRSSERDEENKRAGRGLGTDDDGNGEDDDEDSKRIKLVKRNDAAM
jgi:hypothetical protein